MNKLEIIKHLEGLADGSIKPLRDNRGICDELTTRFDIDGYGLVETFAEDWPKFSGRIAFPVPCPGEQDAHLAYMVHIVQDSIWNGQYGANRRELCAFVAKRMREELE